MRFWPGVGIVSLLCFFACGKVSQNSKSCFKFIVIYGALLPEIEVAKMIAGVPQTNEPMSSGSGPKFVIL